MKTSTVDVGQITVEEDGLFAGDPCYFRSGPTGWGIHHVKKCLAGQWRVEIEVSDEGDWGRRVASLIAYHSNGDNVRSNKAEVAALGVDSGQQMLVTVKGTQAWVDNDYNLAGGHNPTVKDNIQHHEQMTYDGACLATLSKQHAGILGDGLAAVSSTGFGDGVYPLFEYRNTDGDCVKVQIDFIWDNDEEEEEWEEDDDVEEDDEDDE